MAPVSFFHYIFSHSILNPQPSGLIAEIKGYIYISHFFKKAFIQLVLIVASTCNMPQLASSSTQVRLGFTLNILQFQLLITHSFWGRRRHSGISWWVRWEALSIGLKLYSTTLMFKELTWSEHSDSICLTSMHVLNRWTKQLLHGAHGSAGNALIPISNTVSGKTQ